MITRAPLTADCCSGTASSHRFNWDANSDSTEFSQFWIQKWRILRFEYHEPAWVASLYAIVFATIIDRRLNNSFGPHHCGNIQKRHSVLYYLSNDTIFYYYIAMLIPMMVSQTRRISWILKQFGTCKKYLSILARKLTWATRCENSIPILVLSGSYDGRFFCSSPNKPSFLDPALKFLVPRKSTDEIFG